MFAALARRRRPHDGPLRLQPARALTLARPAVRARRQLLRGRVRRLVPEPPVPDLRVRAARCRALRRHEQRVAERARRRRTPRASRSSRRTPARPASALDRPARRFKTGNIAPLDYFGTGDGYRAVNTMQPPYQPSGNAPPAGATGIALLYANPAAATTLPPQTQTTIGDLLTAQGGQLGLVRDVVGRRRRRRHAALDGRPRTVIYTPSTPRAHPGLPGAPPPVQLLRALRSGRARRRSRRAPEGLQRSW